jgi:hypothetical protein
MGDSSPFGLPAALPIDGHGALKDLHYVSLGAEYNSEAD